MTRVMLTGSCGFIGSHVVDALLAAGHEVLCLDNLSTGKRNNIPRGMNFCKVDVTHWWDIVSEFVDFEPEAVIHLAAQPSIFHSIDQPICDAHNNIIGTLNCIQAARRIGTVKKFVFASTSAVYDFSDADEVALSTTESCTLRPCSPYGISKLAAESYVRNLMPDGGVVLRFANIYGPRQVPLGENQVIPRMIKHFEKGDKFFIHGDGEQKRDFLYVTDVAQACLKALDGNPGTYNISSNSSFSINELAGLMECIYEVPGYKWEHTDQQDPRRRTCLDNKRALVGLGWLPSIDLKDGLKKTVAWWKSQ